MPSLIQGLERFRLTTDWSWFRRYYDKMGSEAYWEFTNRVYNAIESLSPFCRYDLTRISEENQELFIKIACEYIQEHNGIDACGIQFSNDWTFLYRTKEYTKS